MIKVLLRFLFKPLYELFRSDIYKELKLRDVSRGRGSDQAGQVSLGGELFFFHHAGSFANQYREIFLKEIYHFHASDARPVIIDGGANMGIAVRFWKKKYPDAFVTAIEPDPAIFLCLKRNLEGFTQGIELIEAMLWSKSGNERFSADGRQGGRRGSGDREVKAILLSDLLRQRMNVDLLKLDLEGAEHEVLFEARSELHRAARIFIEYHSFEGSAESLVDILQLLNASGFSYKISGESWNKPFVDAFPDIGLRYTLNIFAFRI
jgi:FkbM family methyltransferase